MFTSRHTYRRQYENLTASDLATRFKTHMLEDVPFISQNKEIVCENLLALDRKQRGYVAFHNLEKEWPEEERNRLFNLGVITELYDSRQMYAVEKSLLINNGEYAIPHTFLLAGVASTIPLSVMYGVCQKSEYPAVLVTSIALPITAIAFTGALMKCGPVKKPFSSLADILSKRLQDIQREL